MILAATGFVSWDRPTDSRPTDERTERTHLTHRAAAWLAIRRELPPGGSTPQVVIETNMLWPTHSPP